MDKSNITTSTVDPTSTTKEIKSKHTEQFLRQERIVNFTIIGAEMVLLLINYRVCEAQLHVRPIIFHYNKNRPYKGGSPVG